MVKRFQPERPDKLIRVHLSEPSPLGLFGLAVGSLLFACYNIKWTKGEVLMIPWLYYLPGLLQLIAGIVDYFRHNIFGATAFTGYASFWFGIASIFTSVTSDIDSKQLPKPILQHTGVVCVAYLIFSIGLTIISLGLNRILLFILVFIDFAFLFLTLHIFAETKSELVGASLIPVILACFYGFIAIQLNKIAGGIVLPIGAPLVNWSNFIYDDGLTKSGHLPIANKKTQSSSKLKNGNYSTIVDSNYTNNFPKSSENKDDNDDDDNDNDSEHQINEDKHQTDIELGDTPNNHQQ